MLSAQGPLIYGFEKEDVAQEMALGVIMSEKCKPGNIKATESRAKTRAGRHKKKEREWNNFRVSIISKDKPVDMEKMMFNRVLLHEVLDLIPYSLKKETLNVLLKDGDERKINRLGKAIARLLPMLQDT